ncbi:hypothetical protein Nepgr_030976 [Nepenthes gracilis]|uniref:Mechanosensitive ion channel MscS domain-containing protein n=1 Tax=Nepenthes gracilis TaxID=150966 RepID=A0AAD3TFS3_NEPGR|nr:hypothetical protein Nepgr_030976 [Nepenthes gracilis]
MFHYIRANWDTSNTDIIFHIVKWSLTSLLIFSFCWLLKTVLLLKWEAHAVYNRFRDRILRAGFQLYFLACISGTYWDIFKPKEKGEAEKNGHGRNGHEPEKTELPENMRGLERKPTIEKTNVERVKSKKEMEEENRFIKDIKRHMLSEEATTYDIKHMAKKFVTLAKLSSRDQDDDIFEILEECQKNFPHDHGDISKEDLLKFEVDENEAELLYVELQGENHSATVSYETLEKWMVRAHKNCLALGYTLIDAKEVVNCLNKLMSGVVIIAVILSWLFLMKIATTKLIVLIASPLLAATFIFGDTCKTLFEGIIFAFVRHPFDVGDRCIIDGIEMEVKQLGILSTTFLKIGGREESIYPNSVLVTKPIDNLKGDPDPNDCIELNLDPTTDKSQIDELEKKIKKYLELDRGVKYDDYCRTVIKGIENNIRTAVHFKHTMSTLDVTHSQCYEKKNKQRSELLLELKQFLQDLNIKATTN